MGSFGITEIAIIVGVIVLIFGAKRLPEIGKSMGKALRNFKSSVTGEDTSDSDDKKES